MLQYVHDLFIVGCGSDGNLVTVFVEESRDISIKEQMVVILSFVATFVINISALSCYVLSLTNKYVCII